MLIYKEPKHPGVPDICAAQDTICVGLGGRGVGGGRMVIGSSLLIQACTERTACPWPDAAGRWCIPRVIYYPKEQARRS